MRQGLPANITAVVVTLVRLRQIPGDPMLRKWQDEQPDPALIEKYLDDIHPLGYCPEGDVIADACVFLLSDKARFITGTILPVSGDAELGYRSMR